MRGWYRFPILLSVFICLFAFSASRPAQAAMQVEDPWVLAKVIQQLKEFKDYVLEFLDFKKMSEELGLKEIASITGIGADMPSIKCKSALPNLASSGGGGGNSLGGAATQAALIPFWQDCVLPEELEREKRSAGQTASMIAAAQAQSDRMVDSAVNVQFKMDRDKAALATTLGGLAVPDTLCPNASVMQSNSAAEYAVELLRERAMREAMAETSGAKGTPYAQGPIKFASQLISERVRLKLCKNTGQDGVDKFWCPDTDPVIENRDLSAEVYTPRVFQEDSANLLNYAQYARMYVRNIFMDRAFQPIPASEVKNGEMSSAAEELLAKRFNYTALASTFQQPFIQAEMERQALPDMKAYNSLKAVMERAGYSGKVLQDFMLDNGGVSRESMRYIQYKAMNEDPMRIVDDLSTVTAAQNNNVQAFNVMMTMNVVTLLWDNLKEQERTNRILGGLGALMLKDYFAEIDGRIKSISSGSATN